MICKKNLKSMIQTGGNIMSKYDFKIKTIKLRIKQLKKEIKDDKIYTENFKNKPFNF